MKLGISPLAEQDMEAIGDYIAQDNPVRAVSFTEVTIPAMLADSRVAGYLQRKTGTGTERQKLYLRALSHRVHGAGHRSPYREAATWFAGYYHAVLWTGGAGTLSLIRVLPYTSERAVRSNHPINNLAD